MSTFTLYKAKKEELIKAGFPWLNAFNDTIDVLAFSEIKKIEKDESPHNGYLVEKNLNALSRSCLLYTSPSPRDATLSRMPSSA